MFGGKKVRLRAMEQSDLASEHAFVNDYETLRGMTSGLPLPSSMSDAQDFISHQSRYTRGEYQFAIENLEGRMIGRCGVTQLDWKNRLGELAIMLGPEWRGQGCGTEAMALLCRWCFREMNLHKLKVSVFAFNEAAVRCYLANGFVQEGCLKREIFRDGQWRDVLILSRMADETTEACE